MKFIPFPELITSRLRLRKLTMKDVPVYYERIGSSPEVTKYMLFQPHRDIPESVASIKKALGRYREGRCYRFCIALRDTDELIGVIEPLRFNETDNSCSFAYMLGKDYWGQGYGTEALRAVLDFLFGEMGMERVEADHMAENTASGAVMRKAGMIRTGVVPGKYQKDGTCHDAVCYCITREQWEQNR
jgi:ribosomal-protein-alanine N-acetyltransferase